MSKPTRRPTAQGIGPGDLPALRENFMARLHGESIASWAIRNKLTTQSVYNVLQGRVRGLRGESYRAATLIAQTINSQATSA